MCLQSHFEPQKIQRRLHAFIQCKINSTSLLIATKNSFAFIQKLLKLIKDLNGKPIGKPSGVSKTET